MSSGVSATGEFTNQNPNTRTQTGQQQFLLPNRANLFEKNHTKTALLVASALVILYIAKKRRWIKL